MSKIDRFQGSYPAFSRDSESGERWVFATQVESDDLTENINAAFVRGWGSIDEINGFPTMEQFNAVSFTLGQTLAYLHQMGVPEWHENQQYFEGAITIRNRALYRAAQDNVGTDPMTDDGTNWKVVPRLQYGRVEKEDLPATADSRKLANYNGIGYLYSGSADNTVRKISPDGDEVWSFTGHTDTVWAVAVDAAGYLYSGSVDNTLRKITPDGDEVWSFTGHTATVLTVAVDPGLYGAGFWKG